MCAAPGSSTSRPRGAAAASRAAQSCGQSRSRVPRTTTTGARTSRSRRSVRSGAATRHSAAIALGPVRPHWARTSGTCHHGSAHAVPSQRPTSRRADRSRGSVVGPSSTTATTRGSRAATATTWQLWECPASTTGPSPSSARSRSASVSSRGTGPGRPMPGRGTTVAGSRSRTPGRGALVETETGHQDDANGTGRHPDRSTRPPREPRTGARAGRLCPGSLGGSQDGSARGGRSSHHDDITSACPRRPRPARRPAARGHHRLRVRRPVRGPGAAQGAGGRHDHRQDRLPPLPAAALPGRDRHPLRGRDRPATREILRQQENALVLLGEVTDIDLAARTVTSTVLGRTTVHPYDELIVAAGAGQSYFGNDRFAEFAPGMKSIDDALELRGRIFGAFELAELADRPGRDRPAAHLRRRRRRADRRGDGRPDRGAGPAHPAPRLPPHRPDHRPRGPPGRRPLRAALVRREARRARPAPAQPDRRRGAARRDGHRRRRRRHRDQGRRRAGPPHQRRHQDLGRRRAGQPAGPDARRAVRRRGRPRRPGGGAARPDPSRSPRGARRRRHDGAGQAARRRPGGHPGRPVLRRPDQATAGRQGAPRRRSSTTTRARWRRSPGSTPSSTSAS